MNKLKDFMNILTGSFNNSEQFDKMKLDSIDFPLKSSGKFIILSLQIVFTCSA